MEKGGKGCREAREEMEPKEFKGVEKEGERESKERFPMQGCVAGCVLLFC